MTISRARIKVGLAPTLVFLAWASAAASATFTDALGREVYLAGEPQKIVTLAPSLTEIVYFLGLGERVAGVTTFSDYPPQAARKPKVGSYVDLNVERIISLAPDLVLGTADGNQPAVVRLLEQAGIPVFVVNPRSVHEVIDTLQTVGRLCGVPETATDLAQGLALRVNQVMSKTAALEKPVVFLQVNLKPIMTVNENTFGNDLIRLAGGRNMMAEAPMNYPRINVEEVIRRGPEVILISSMERGGAFEQAKRYWHKWRSIPAVEDDRVHLVDSSLIDRPSPRIVEGLEMVARYIHPEVNWDE